MLHAHAIYGMNVPPDVLGHVASLNNQSEILDNSAKEWGTAKKKLL